MDEEQLLEQLRKRRESHLEYQEIRDYQIDKRMRIKRERESYLEHQEIRDYSEDKKMRIKRGHICYRLGYEHALNLEGANSTIIQNMEDCGGEYYKSVYRDGFDSGIKHKKSQKDIEAREKWI